MTSISVGTKVNVHIGGQLLPGVVVSHQFASSAEYDLYVLRIAHYNQATQRWLISQSGPVPSSRLSIRTTYVPGLDQREQVKSHLRSVPQWVKQLQS